MTEEAPLAKCTIDSDVAKLHEVMVLAPSPSHFIETGLRDENFATYTASVIREKALIEHEEFVSTLSNFAVCRDLGALLDSALENAEKTDIETLLRDLSPRLAEGREIDIEIVNADFLLGRTRESEPFVNPLSWAFFTRDLFVNTPRGIILSSFLNYDRCLELKLARFLFQFAPQLSAYEVVFDAGNKNLFLQGGDIIVKSERTLLIGVGSTTERKAAKEIARDLELEVIAVQMPVSDVRERGYADWNGVNSLFYHLDSVLNLVDYDKVLTLPYFLEEEYRNSNPFYDYLRNIDKRIRADLNHSKRHQVYTEEPLRVIDQLKDIGSVTVYDAGSAKERNTGQKIVDYLRDDGYSLIPVGGELIDEPEHSIVEKILWELKWQAANVVCLQPGHILTCEGNRHTLAALDEAGINVEAFDGDELARGHGGAHCLTAPLRRGI